MPKAFKMRNEDERDKDGLLGVSRRSPAFRNITNMQISTKFLSATRQQKSPEEGLLT